MNLYLVFALSAYFFVDRILVFLLQHMFVSKQCGLILRIYSLIFCILVFVFAKYLAAWIVFLQFLQIFSLILFVVLHNFVKEQTWKQNFPMILDQIIMKMRCGTSFSSSFKYVCANSESFMQQKLNSVWDSVNFSQQNDFVLLSSFDLYVVERFKLIQQHPHNSQKRILLWRKELKLQNEFRRRSGQISYQIKIQSLIMCVLYIVLFLFSSYYFGWKEIKQLCFVSFSLFCIGVFWVFNSGAKLKCNI